jgi:DnaJ-class molecular chaperone
MLSCAAALLLLQADPGALAGKIARGFSAPDHVDAADESAARSSSAFGPRFAVLLLDLHRSLERGRGYETVYRSLAQFNASGGPAGIADVVRSLAAGFKKSAYCGECKDGRVACPECKGRGRLDFLKCRICSGEGRVRPSGAVGNSDVTMKCRNCEGFGGFKNAGCASCSRSGTAPCPTCLGRPWHDRECSVADCRAGRIRCEACGGRGRVDVRCSECEGKGRNRASGATPGADVSVRCRGCEGKGKLADPAPCSSCDATGRIPCKTCRGGRPSGPQRRITLASILTLATCNDCAGKGGTCPACAGLGLQVRGAEPGPERE